MSSFGWGPPALGQMMPDGLGRIENVTIYAAETRLQWIGVVVRDIPGGQLRGIRWPVTNRKAKRLRRKAWRRARKLWARTCPGYAAAERRCEVGQ